MRRRAQTSRAWHELQNQAASLLSSTSGGSLRGQRAMGCAPANKVEGVWAGLAAHELAAEPAELTHILVVVTDSCLSRVSFELRNRMRYRALRRLCRRCEMTGGTSLEAGAALLGQCDVANTSSEMLSGLHFDTALLRSPPRTGLVPVPNRTWRLYLCAVGGVCAGEE